VTVQPGDTISGIAQNYGGFYNREAEWKVANPHIRDLNKIKPGDKIVVP